MELTEDGAFVRLRGLPGAIREGGTALRVSNPRIPTSPAIYVAADGSFSVRIAGLLSDLLYLERLAPDADETFLIQVQRSTGSSVTALPMPPDRDMDLSPDAIDCAPDDPLQSGQRCGPIICNGDVECPMGQVCIAGMCTLDSCLVAEVCGDGIDNDCDGMMDDGC